MRFLCIDDDPTFLAVYRSVLTPSLHPDDQLELCDSGEKGVSLCNATLFHLVITDLILPQMSGIDVLRSIKEQTPCTEVIVVTGQGSIDSAVEAMHLGARDYLTKPLNADILLEKCATMRELYTRCHEAEEYRLAKETTEAEAVRCVSALEIRVGDCLTLIDAIGAAVNTQAAPEQIVETIREHLVTFRGARS